MSNPNPIGTPTKAQYWLGRRVLFAVENKLRKNTALKEELEVELRRVTARLLAANEELAVIADGTNADKMREYEAQHPNVVDEEIPPE